MKASIKIATAGKMTQKQIDVIRRVTDVLAANGMSVKTEIKTKTVIKPILKAV